MILIITHSADVGADLVIRHLVAKHADFLRIDSDFLGTPHYHFGFEDGCPTFEYGGHKLLADAVSAVWARRFASPAIIEAVSPIYRTFTLRELTQTMEPFLEHVSGLQVNAYQADRRAGNRLYQSIVARSVGLLVPDTLVT